LIWDVKLLLANAQTVQLVIISKMTACKLEVQNVIPSRKDAVQFKTEGTNAQMLHHNPRFASNLAGKNMETRSE